MVENISYQSIVSPIGRIGIWATEKGVCSVEIGVGTKKNFAASHKSNSIAEKAASELTQYFSGTLRKFSVPVDMSGTEFQKSVWREIAKTGFGKTLSYSEIAHKIANPKASRAVGGAVGANPVPIIIGCHRVMGASGAITGYSGGKGIATKKQLLILEGIKTI